MPLAASVEFPKEPSRDLFYNAEITCHLKMKERLPRVFAKRLRRDREERNQSDLFMELPRFSGQFRAVVPSPEVGDSRWT